MAVEKIEHLSKERTLADRPIITNTVENPPAQLEVPASKPNAKKDDKSIGKHQEESLENEADLDLIKQLAEATEDCAEEPRATEDLGPKAQLEKSGLTNSILDENPTETSDDDDDIKVEYIRDAVEDSQKKMYWPTVKDEPSVVESKLSASELEVLDQGKAKEQLGIGRTGGMKNRNPIHGKKNEVIHPSSITANSTKKISNLYELSNLAKNDEFTLVCVSYKSNIDPEVMSTTDSDDCGSLNSNISIMQVRASELYPKKSLMESQESASLTPPFSPLCGEAIEFMGRTSEGGMLAVSNYRLYLQRSADGRADYNIPLGLIESVEVKDLFHLIINCKDARTCRCSFPTNDTCNTWFRRLHNAISSPRNVTELFAFVYYAWACEEGEEEICARLGRDNYVVRDTFRSEIERMRFDIGNWRISDINKDFQLCPSYPRYIIVPAKITDQMIEAAARFRSTRRVPAVVWRHKENGLVIARCSQPEVGWLGWRSTEDEELLKAIAESCASPANNLDRVQKPVKVLLMDARSYTTALANRARGGGVECADYYPNIEIEFKGLANIHVVRKSFLQIRNLFATPDHPNFHGVLQSTNWLYYLSQLINAANGVVESIEKKGKPVVVHCSDGWDRTSQIVSLAELFLDPYYRTVEGFQVLCEREWLDFGHKFADRCGIGEDMNEKCPIFLQWLDCVQNILIQFPCAFEFSKRYLIKLAEHTYSNLFGTFLCNTAAERLQIGLAQKTFSVWRYLNAPHFKNYLYDPNHKKVLVPLSDMSALHVWRDLYADLSYDIKTTANKSEPLVLTNGDHISTNETHQEPENGNLNHLGNNNLGSMIESAINCHPEDMSSDTSSPRSNGLEKENGFLEGAENGVNHRKDDFENDTTSSSTDAEPTCCDDKFGSAAVPEEKDKVQNLIGDQGCFDSKETIFNVDDVDGVDDDGTAINDDERHNEVNSSCDTITNGHADSEEYNLDLEEFSQKLTLASDGDGGGDNGKKRQNGGADVKKRDNNVMFNSLHATNEVSVNNGSNSNTCNEYGKSFEFAGSRSLCANDSYFMEPRTLITTSTVPLIPTSFDPPDTYKMYPKRSNDIPFASASRQHVQSTLLLDPIDGLPLIPDDIQDRMQQILIEYKAKTAALERELHTTRMTLLKRVCNQCSHINMGTIVPTTMEKPALTDDDGSVCSTEISWEAVEEKETQPTLWMPDHAVSQCMNCDNKFWLGRRKHHCRSCGKIFCADCSNNLVPLPNEQLYEPVRVCESCYRSSSSIIYSMSPKQQQQTCKQAAAGEEPQNSNPVLPPTPPI